MINEHQIQIEGCGRVIEKPIVINNLGNRCLISKIEGVTWGDIQGLVRINELTYRCNCTGCKYHNPEASQIGLWGDTTLVVMEAPKISYPD